MFEMKLTSTTYMKGIRDDDNNEIGERSEWLRLSFCTLFSIGFAGFL